MAQANNSDEWVEKMLDIVVQWRPMMSAEETGQIRASVGPFIDKRMHERRVPLDRMQFPTRHDKAVRAQSIRGRMSMDGLHVPTKAPWYAAFQQELLTFPMAKHDDCVDALGLIGQLLTSLLPGQRPRKNTTNGIRAATLIGRSAAMRKFRPMRWGGTARL